MELFPEIVQDAVIKKNYNLNTTYYLIRSILLKSRRSTGMRSRLVAPTQPQNYLTDLYFFLLLSIRLNV